MMDFFILAGIVLLIGITVGLIQMLKVKFYPVPDNHDLAGVLDTEINKLFRGSGDHGVVVGVYKDERLYSKGYGVTSRHSGIVPDAQTVFQIGSITKVFTSSLLLALTDKDVVSLDATLDELIGNSVPMTDTVAKITLRQLAIHTSGLPRIPKRMLRKIEKLAGKKNVMVDPYKYLSVDDMFAYLKSAEDTKPPGKFSYSNYGVGMLAHVLERITGESFEYMLQNEILSTLHMPDTGITLTPQIEQRFSQGHNTKGQPMEIWRFKSLGGAGAVYSTTDDMLQFIKATLEKGTQANDLFLRMSEPQTSGKSGITWMLPGFIEKLHGNQNAVWHNGMTGGYSSYISIDPVSRTGVVILSGKTTDVTMMGVMLTRQVRTQSWAD